MNCPICGRQIRENKGWAAIFYAGYCNHCDVPIENGEAEDESEDVE